MKCAMHFTPCSFGHERMIFPGTSGPAVHQGGFSLIELITVIMVVAIVAAVTVPRFVGTDSFASRGSYDQAIETIRYAQKTAIAWRQDIHVCVTATSVAAASVAGCATPIIHPTTGAPLVAGMPNGVTLAPASFRFNGIGRPLDSGGNPSGTITIAVTSTIAGDPARQIVVEAETGYVHP